MDSLDDISSLKTVTSGQDEIFWSRFDCIHNWYLKASSKTKLKLLNLMIDSLCDDSYLTTILSCFNFIADKLVMYSDCHSTTNYIYDIKLDDHNRGLQNEFLLVTIRKDMIWYSSLEAPDQVRVLSELLKASGGAIIKIIYGVILKRVQTNIKAKARAKATAKPEERVDLNTWFLPKPSLSDQKEEKKPKTALELEIDQKKKVWEDAMKKYRIAVEGKPAKEAGAKGKGKKGKGTKGSKSSKSSKGKKGQKYFVDRVQMLPIWLVKKIFGYLDGKTLKKIAEVNNYWAYVVDDMMKDRKNMAVVQKMVKKMKANIADETIPDLVPSGQPVKLTHEEKKMMKLTKRGAVDKRLKTTIKHPAEDKTLLEKAIISPDTRLRFPTQGYEAFPRLQGENGNLLTLPNIVYTEAGIFRYGRKPEGGAVTIVEFSNYDLIDSAMQSSDMEEISFNKTTK